jgi:hypothetical protein
MADMVAHHVAGRPVGRSHSDAMVPPLLTALAEIVGPGHVLDDPQARAGFETDWTGRCSHPG